MTAAIVVPAVAADAADALVEHDVAKYMQPEAARFLPERPSYLMTRCIDEVPGATAWPNISPHGGDFWAGGLLMLSKVVWLIISPFWCVECPHFVDILGVYILILRICRL